MSLYMVVNDHPTDLSSASGWGLVLDWAEQLDLARYEEIVRLTEHGESTNLPRLAGELADALKNSPPALDATRELAQHVHDTVKDVAKEENGYILISDGTRPGDTDDGEFDEDDDGDDDGEEGDHTESSNADWEINRKIGPYDVRRVPTEAVSPEIMTDGNSFSTYATHYDSPDIEPNTILIADTQSPEEQIYSMLTAIYELRGLSHGLTQDDARARAMAYQKTLRVRAAAIAGHESTVGVPEHPEAVHKERLGTTQDGLAVWLVDAAAVRREVGPGLFMDGANPATCQFVPPDEIWVSSEVPETDRVFVAAKEYVERDCVENDGEPFESAVALATDLEHEWRKSGAKLKINDLSPAFTEEQLDVLRGEGESDPL